MHDYNNNFNYTVSASQQDLHAYVALYIVIMMIVNEHVVMSTIIKAGTVQG